MVSPHIHVGDISYLIFSNNKRSEDLASVRLNVVGLDVPPQTPHSQSGRTECSPRPSHLLNLLPFTELCFYLANTSRASRFQGPPCGCQTVMQPSWRLFLTAWAEPCPREDRWRSFCRAQAVPLPPLPPFRGRGQSCSLRPPLPVHWPVSLDLLLGLDTANLPTIKKLLAHNLLQNHYFTDVVLPPWPPQ